MVVKGNLRIATLTGGQVVNMASPQITRARALTGGQGEGPKAEIVTGGHGQGLLIGTLAGGQGEDRIAPETGTLAGGQGEGQILVDEAEGIEVAAAILRPGLIRVRAEERGTCCSRVAATPVASMLAVPSPPSRCHAHGGWTQEPIGRRWPRAVDVSRSQGWSWRHKGPTLVPPRSRRSTTRPLRPGWIGGETIQRKAKNMCPWRKKPTGPR